MKYSDQNLQELEAIYAVRYRKALVPVAVNLREHIVGLLEEQPRIDRIAVRAKNPRRFLAKAATIGESGVKYSEPLGQIQDQLGARIVVFYRDDVKRVEAIVKQYFATIENRDLVPETDSEFGYFRPSSGSRSSN